MKLGLIVRRVTEAKSTDGVLTAVRFDYIRDEKARKESVTETETALGTLLFVRDLSYVYPGPPRHRVGDKITINIEDSGDAASAAG
jgi:hypothetical protein